ncbi:MAG: hypothetical protein ACT6RD_04150 [Brevundimonas sp.]|uniref:hypothetical protein n=1 Tax=Brevundimonas sp. TaxID=1871086 RepID=UPI004033B390
MNGLKAAGPVLALVLLAASAAPALACTYVDLPPEVEARLELERENAMVDGADLIYFGSLWSTGGPARNRYAIRGVHTIRGGHAPVYAETAPRYETSCGRGPTYSLDGVRRLLPGQQVIVVARRRSWWRIEIVEVARRESVRGRRIYSRARSRAAQH